MNNSSFNLSLLIIGILSLRRETLADDFHSQVERLKKSQASLDQLMLPFHTPDGSADATDPVSQEPKSPILQFHTPTTRLQGQAGKLIFGKLVNRLVVGGEKSPVIIEIKSGQSVFSGMRALGVAIQGSTPGRISIEIQKLVFKSGSARPISGVGLDQDGALGIEAQVISQKALSVAGAMASSFISGLATSQQSVSSNAFGFESTQRSSRNALLGGLAQTAADQSKRLIEESTSEKPVMIVEVNTPITIMLQEEVRL